MVQGLGFRGSGVLGIRGLGLRVQVGYCPPSLTVG